MFSLLIFLFLVAGAVAGGVFVRIKTASIFAIKDNKDDVELFGGFLRLLLWKPNKGLIILKNKQIAQVIPNGDVELTQQGGMIFISALRGEELYDRLQLSLSMMEWEDENILTRESIRVRMKVAIFWKVKNLSTFAFSINRGINLEQSHLQVSVLDAAEVWLRTLTESTLRTCVSQASIATLVSSNATSYLQVALRHDGNTGSIPLPEMGAPEAITEHLCGELSKKVKEYGVEVQRVEVKEVSISRDIQEAIDKVWKAALLPAQTEQEARAKQIELQSLANVIGIDNVAMNELLKNFQGSNFYSPPPFIDVITQKMHNSSPSQKALSNNASTSSLTDTVS